MLLGLVNFLNNGCKPKDCHEIGGCAEEYYRIRIKEPKSYLWALPGSYWIYKNTKTGDLDTQTCIGFLYDSVKVRGDQPNSSFITIEYDVLRRTIKSSFNQWNYSDGNGPNSPNFENFNSGRIILHRIASNTSGEISPFFYPFNDGDATSNGSSATISKGMDTSLIVQGNTYYNVAKFDIDMDDIWYSTNQYPNAIYYWAKDVGLIKRWNKSENYSWELIDYKIIK